MTINVNYEPQYKRKVMPILIRKGEAIEFHKQNFSDRRPCLSLVACLYFRQSPQEVDT